MNPLNRRNVNHSQAVADLSSVLNYSPQASGDRNVSNKPVTNTKKRAPKSNNKKFNQGLFPRQLHGKKLVDSNNLNRDTMAPNTIIVTRANLIGHGEVPFVESTDMGPVMYCQLVIEDGELSVHALIADEDSVSSNKPEFIGFISPQVKRLEVGAEGRIPLIDHDFESGEELRVNGERVHSIFVHGGVNDTIESCEVTGPTLIAVFKDRPSISEYQVGYIRFECYPVGNASALPNERYFQVFQCPGHHH